MVLCLTLQEIKLFICSMVTIFGVRMHCQSIFILLAVLVVGCDTSNNNHAKKTETNATMWPKLDEIGAVSGRSATSEDVAAGRAVFVLQSNGTPIGKPLEIVVPQYAYHVDPETGTRTAGIIIQAEDAGMHKIVGFLALPDKSILAGTFAEFELLGIKPPK
jgi:hypothetical protein